MIVRVFRSEQGRHGDVVHVAEDLVLTHHAPDEGIGLSAHACMQGPAGADDSLLVANHNVASLSGLAHHVEHHRLFVHVEVKINFHAAVVCVAGHGVPQAAWFELCQTH